MSGTAALDTEAAFPLPGCHLRHYSVGELNVPSQADISVALLHRGSLPGSYEGETVVLTAGRGAHLVRSCDSL